MLTLGLVKIFIMALLQLFTCVGIGAFSYALLPSRKKQWSILIGCISIYPVMVAFFYLVSV